MKISKHSETESHNTGKNCMDCHKTKGPGEGDFLIAGSCYDSTFTNPYPNASINLYTEPGGAGQLIYTLEVDGNGNFYSTEAVSFLGGLYPTITGTSGNVHYMNGAITHGACNSCHNYTNCKICIK
jgi:hypothetical protein